MKDHVRIVVCGDPRVGKTSIIKTLISETFDDQVPAVLNPILVPPDVSPEQVSVSIVDTSSAFLAPAKGSTNDEKASAHAAETLDAELRRANVIILVYDVSNPQTLTSASETWLKRLEKMDVKVPVILVGNKTDLRSGLSDELESMIRPVMEEHRILDVCIECSAKKLFNIAEVFYFAQKSVLHPTAPLYDVGEHSLRPRANAALKRIFKLCDKDNDGKLSDTELNEFQYHCFSVHLKPDELSGVKNVVRDACPQGLSGDSCLNLEGFVFLHTLFIQKGRLETTWTVIRKFGYDDDLLLRNDYADTSIKKTDDQNVELSDTGTAFLKAIFSSTDTDKDGLLSHEDIADLFSPCPEDPWANHQRWVVEPQSKPGFWTLESFISRWAMFLLDDPETALLALVYIGFPTAPGKAIKVSKKRKLDRRKRTVSRNVFRCLVIGAASSGKSELVGGLVGHTFGRHPPVEDHTVGSVGPVSYELDQTKTLAMLEVPVSRLEVTTSSKNFLDGGDLAAIVYDVSDPSSFEQAATLYATISNVRDNLPCVFIGTKADLPPAKQSFDVSPAEFCISRGLPEPVLVSLKAGEDQNIYEMLVQVGMNPEVACPGYYETVEGSSSMTTYASLGAGVICLGLFAYVGWKSYKSYSAGNNTGSGSTSRA